MMKEMYQNPILKGFYPDPSICKVKGKYYLITSSFEYFPGIPIFESSDLVNWQQIGHCLTTKGQLNLEESGKSQGIFAPTIRYHQGRFYVVTTNITTKENFIVYSDDDCQSWSQPVVITGWQGIDPSLFFDEDGRVYLQGNAYKSTDTLGIYQAELDPITLQVVSKRALLTTGTGGKAPEAPHLFKRNGYYYLLMAEGGTEYGHMATIFRSQEISGPYEACPHNPILTNRSIKSAVQCVGHGDFIQGEDGHWWVVCLGIRVKGSHSYYHHLGRETFLAPVQWQEDWPVVNGTGHLELAMTGPLSAYQIIQKTDLAIDFKNCGVLPQELVFLRNPNSQHYQLTNQGLELTGSVETVNDVKEVTFIGTRQREFAICFETDFDVLPDSLASFGVTVFMSYDFHYDVIYNPKEQTVSLVKRIGSIHVVEKQIETPAFEEIRFQVLANDKEYQFAVEINGATLTLGTGECAFLASELSGTFTGVILAGFCYSETGEKTIMRRLQVTELE